MNAFPLSRYPGRGRRSLDLRFVRQSLAWNPPPAVPSFGGCERSRQTGCFALVERSNREVASDGPVIRDPVIPAMSTADFTEDDDADDRVPCVRCDYDLRGLAPDARCPECGLLVRYSDPVHASLRHAPPGWLASLSWGARLALVSFLLFLLLPSVSSPAFASIPTQLFPLFLAVLASGVTAIFVLGAWLLTRPHMRFAPPNGVVRLAARFTAFLPLVSELVAFVPRRPLVLQFLRGSAVLLWLLAVVFLLLHLRRLALRLPQPALAGCCMAGVAAFATTVALFIVDDALGLTPAAGLEIAGVVVALSGCAALVAVLAWSAGAFHRACISSRQAWEQQA